MFALEGGDFTEFKSDLVGKGLAILRADSLSGFEINLVSDNDSTELAFRVLLLDALIPDTEELEGIEVSNVIHKHDLVSFAQ